MRMRSLLVALAILPGCYCAHAADPDAGADAPIDAPRDAGPDVGPLGARWLLVAGPAATVAQERCLVRQGATTLLHVEVTTNLCDEPANVAWSIDPAARRVTLSPAVWRPIGIDACPPGTVTFTEEVELVGQRLEAGMWEVVLEDGSARATFVVAEPSEPSCAGCLADGETCGLDAECAAPLRCVAMRGDAVCGARCGLPCTPFPREARPDGSAPGDLTCSRRLGDAARCEDDPSYGPLCRRAAADLCPPCPDGTLCGEGDAWTSCAWDPQLELAGATCTSDLDCRPGESCIVASSTAPIGQCSVRCRSQHVCPTGEECGFGHVCPVLIGG